ncbi:MAG: cob(I)yrinic acid a,c-diamide adenosyltransferase [Chitinophagales bacterium]
MKIYTKTGDKGSTSLYGGKRLSKAHIRIDAYGTVDELNSYIGLIRDLTENEADKIFLLNIQNVLFNVGSNLASDPEKEKSKMIPDVLKTDYEALENEIDEINKILEPLQYFILPGGHSSISHCHIARCVCRRAERICVALNEIEPVNEELIIYLNRLSDYLFTYARKMAKFLNAEELKWQVNK